MTYEIKSKSLYMLNVGIHGDSRYTRILLMNVAIKSVLAWFREQLMLGFSWVKYM